MKVPLSILFLLALVFSIIDCKTTTKATIWTCPRDCKCESTISTATCRQLDPAVQHFNDDIKNLVIKTINPKTTIELTANIFKTIGLRSIEKIRIVNATITKLHPTAFAGLSKLISVDLRSTGLTSINPDLFATNPKLKTINLSDNPIEHKYEYILNSTTLEEIVICNARITHLNSTSLSKLPNAVFISFNNNRIKKIDVKSFSKLINLESLDLANNQIVDIPLLLFVSNTELTSLKLANNSLAVKSINSESLESLDISYCNIKELTERMFDDCPNLLNLKVTNNGLERVDANAFNELVELTELDLSHNNLVNIPYQLFYNNRLLTSINLSYNPIRNLPDKGFISKYSIIETMNFDLSHCEIETLHELTFLTMPALNELYLNNNRIKVLPAQFLQHLLSLKVIDLSNNEVELITSNVFELNRDLHILNLNNNPLKYVPEEAFINLVNLISLDLSNCKLTEFKWSIPEVSLDRLQTLKSLNLSNNELTSLNSDLLSMTPNLLSFDIGNNPLKCDLEFSGLIEWLVSHNIQVAHVDPTHLPNIQMLTESNSETDQKFRWNELTKRICNDQTLSHIVTTEKLNSTSYSDYDYYYESYDQSTTNNLIDDDDEEDEDEPELEDDFEDPEEVKETLMRYANYTNVIMFLIGAMSSATVVFLMAWICKSYRGQFGVRRTILLNQAAFIDNLSNTKRTKKDCGLVYKQLSEETIAPRTPVFARLYEPYLASLNGNTPQNGETPTYQQMKGTPSGDMV